MAAASISAAAGAAAAPPARRSPCRRWPDRRSSSGTGRRARRSARPRGTSACGRGRRRSPRGCRSSSRRGSRPAPSSPCPGGRWSFAGSSADRRRAEEADVLAVGALGEGGVEAAGGGCRRRGSGRPSSIDEPQPAPPRRAVKRSGVEDRAEREQPGASARQPERAAGAGAGADEQSLAGDAAAALADDLDDLPLRARGARAG